MTQAKSIRSRNRSRRSAGSRPALARCGIVIGSFPPGLATPKRASGRLDWADGDDSERKITVTILDDKVDDPGERFSIGIHDPQGGALGLEHSSVDYETSVDIGIIDDDEAAPPTNPPPTSPPMSANGSGGGGSLSWATLLVVSGLLLARQRRLGTRSAQRQTSMSNTRRRRARPSSIRSLAIAP
jgi:hypothetical protein